MSLTLQAEPVPLRLDDQGAIRVGQTRVLLELVVEAYQAGETPETIVRWFDSLQLADVYAVISYYLKHTDEVEAYLRRREELAAQVPRTIEAGQSSRPNFREQISLKINDSSSDPVSDEPICVPAPGENKDEPKKKPRRHLLGLPPGYKFDPKAKPTMEDLYGIPACFGDDEPLGQSRTESDKLSAGD